MKPFIDYFFSKFHKIDSAAWLNSLQKVALLQSDIKRLNLELDEAASNLVKEQSESLYISLKDLITIVSKPKFNMSDVISSSKHIAEMSSQAYSTIEVYPIVEDEHIVLCPDTKSCEKHRDYCGDKIKIVTIR